MGGIVMLIAVAALCVVFAVFAPHAGGLWPILLAAILLLIVVMLSVGFAKPNPRPVYRRGHDGDGTGGGGDDAAPAWMMPGDSYGGHGHGHGHGHGDHGGGHGGDHGGGFGDGGGGDGGGGDGGGGGGGD